MASECGAGTQISRIFQRLARLQQPEYGLSDDERGERNDRIANAVTGLMRVPGDTLDDIGCKLAVVCARLRAEDHCPSSPNGALTILLAESARDDVVRMAAAEGEEEMEETDAGA